MSSFADLEMDFVCTLVKHTKFSVPPWKLNLWSSETKTVKVFKTNLMLYLYSYNL